MSSTDSLKKVLSKSFVDNHENINNVLTCKASQINGKQGGIIYMPTAKHSRPYHGYDARIDTTILDSVRNKLVNVSGRLIPNRDLQMKYDYLK